MKSTRKHELQTNELADFLGRLIERGRPHGRAITYVALAVAVLVIVLVVLPAMRSSASPEVAASAAFLEAQGAGDASALRNFLHGFPNSPQVPIAKMLLADRIVSEVVRGSEMTGAGDIKARAPALLAEARDFYVQAADASPRLAPMARLGQALVTVQQGDLDQGRKALEEIGKAYPGSIAADLAKAHLEELAGYKPVQFSNEAPTMPTRTSGLPAGAPPPPVIGPPGLKAIPSATGEPKGTPATKVAPKPPEAKPAGTSKAEPKPPETRPTETPKAPEAKPAATAA